MIVRTNSLKSALKSTAIRGLHVSGVTRATVRFLGIEGVILMFHEIHDDPHIELWTGCRTEFLERSIKWLRKTGWQIVTLKEAIGRLHHDAPARRFAVITFDDGYRDNIVRALPILKREKVPFTVYIPSAAITRDLFAWWLGLRELFRQHDRVDIAAMDRSFFCADLPSKIRSLAVATSWVHKNYRHISDLRDTFVAYGISLQGLCNRYFMNENELRFLAREPLASIGAHTVTHPALSMLDAQNASREMIDNRAYLQECFDLEAVDLAYPFGSPPACGPREARLAAEAGFRSAATTSNRPLFAQDEHELFSLARISIHPHWTLAHLNAAISGLTVPSVRRIVSNWSHPRTFFSDQPLSSLT